MGVPTNESNAGKRIRHFVGVESSKQLAFIDDLHRLGLSRTVDLPELIVVGDQNTGKSSVLQAITEISFPVESALCTRFPIKISFRQTPGTSTSVQAEIIPGRKTQDDDEFLERIKDFRFTSDELSANAMNQIIKEATERIFGDDNGAGQTLSDAILRIERSGPNEMHWTIVDLPGLVQNRGESSLASKRAMTNGKSGIHTDNAKIAKDLVRSFLENERNIVLWVVDDTDIERHKTLELFEEIPGLQSRTIGVLTKCDRKQETSDNWMVKLLRNEPSTKNHLEQGWFGLRNRKPIEADISDQERDQNEADLFEKLEWAGVRKSQTGIKALMDHIDKERRSRIQESMPRIIGEIRDNLRNCEAELENLGEVRDNTSAERLYVLRFCNELQKMADSALRARYQDIPSDDPRAMLRFQVTERLRRFQEELGDLNRIDPRVGFTGWEIDCTLNQLTNLSPNPENWMKPIATSNGENIYKAIYCESRVCQGTNLPGTISPEVEEKIFRKQSAHWRDIAFDLVNDIKNLVEESHDVFLRIAIPDSRTRGEMMATISKTREAWDAEIDAALEELIDDQQKRPTMTLQPYFLMESQRFNNDLESQVEQSRRNAGVRGTPGKPPEAQGVEGIVGPEHRRAQMPLEVTQIFHLRKRLEVYYGIAMNRFVDNVAMQVVERHVLGPNSPILTISTKRLVDLSDEELHRIAGEDESVTRQRARLNKDRSSYKQALAQWDQVRYF
ncbi:dynamin, putative [Talaromyces stipitatus ATCC 10500]|uniref:Dynamin, putative n=1 Tax=Talaromyces stipitatus (strain ATCC 10500 / CBS 375.48 / QM 6759 / NRRL 1006) TaxID=441959 RepID=B8LUT8_TALSN|nr:dynamin, putative [Talaromyces stipitatus ATCC 10500]EED24030.1 dynamin, putative [Talaromyces stipitatus ATCC 10500]